MKKIVVDELFLSLYKNLCKSFLNIPEFLKYEILKTKNCLISFVIYPTPEIRQIRRVLSPANGRTANPGVCVGTKRSLFVQAKT